MSTTRKAWLWTGAAGFVALCAVAARVLLYLFDVVYDEYPLTLMTIAAVAFMSLTVALAYRAWRIQHGPSPTSHNDAIAFGTAAVAFATAFYAFAQLILPSTPQSAAADACRGAPLHGAAGFGQTTSLGVNARAGVGGAYRVRDRFGPNCSIGFDGFCVGEPIAHDESDSKLPDQRWLIVHGRDEVVAADYVRLQRPQDNFGAAPSRDCDRYHGLNAPGLANWSAKQTKPTTIELSATSRGAVLFGFAVGYTDQQAAGRYPFVQVGYYSPTYGFVSDKSYAPWDMLKSPGVLGSITLTAVGTACYGDDAPVTQSASFEQITFTNGKITGENDLPAAGPAEGVDREALTKEACSIV